MKSAKQVFSDYFDKLQAYSIRRYGTLPTVSFSEQLDPRLVLSAPDEEGEVEWQPVWLTLSPDWQVLEKQIGFGLVDELKAYYSTCLLAILVGEISGRFLNFYPIWSDQDLQGLILRQYEEAQWVFPGSEKFLIGNAIIDGDDGYFIYFDNSDSTVFCYEEDTQKKVPVANSLLESLDSLIARD
jgi:hypothetical protein